MIGKKKITNRDRIVLRGLVCYICQICLRHELDCGELEVHRIRRGVRGGLYCPSNLKIICKSCHKSLHFKEPK